MSPELAGPKTAAANVCVPQSWSKAFSQALNEIRVPLSPTNIVVAGKSTASILAGCKEETFLRGNQEAFGERYLDPAYISRGAILACNTLRKMSGNLSRGEVIPSSRLADSSTPPRSGLPAGYWSTSVGTAVRRLLDPFLPHAMVGYKPGQTESPS